MRIAFPEFPSDKFFMFNVQNYSCVDINHTMYPHSSTLLIFYISSGKYINGYNNNGQRVFSHKIAISSTQISITRNIITFT